MEPLITLKTAIEIARSAIEAITAGRGAFGTTPKSLAQAVEMMLQSIQLTEAAQKDVVALKEENAQLKKRLDECEGFERVRAEHQFREVAPGTFAYVHNSVDIPDKNVPWYCQNCFDERKKSAFQFTQSDFHHDRYTCHHCGASILIPNGSEMTAYTVQTKSRWEDY